MFKVSNGMRVLVAMATTITLEVLLAIWSTKLNYERRELDPSLEIATFWTLIVLATILVVVTLGYKRLTTWVIAICFFVATFLGSFFVSQVILSYYTYYRDFT